MYCPNRRGKSAGARLIVGCLSLVGVTFVHAQTTQAQATAAPPPGAAPAASSREAELEARVRQLEALVNQLSTRVDGISTAPAARPEAPGAATGSRAGAATGSAAGAGGSGTTAGGTPPNPTGSSGISGLGASSGTQPSSPESPKANMPAGPPNYPGKVRFGPGFEISAQSDEYQFQFHNLTQFDGRFYSPSGEQPVHDTFTFPRVWFIFSGRLTKSYEYYVSIQQPFDTILLLDAFLNIHYDDRLQLKIGRYKTPFTYEFYNGPINALIQPERSLFFNNFGLNRDLGIMAWGQLFKKRIDYAVGIFNGTRNGFLDANDQKDLAAYVNFRPFGESDIPALENFNIGGSLDTGNQGNIPVPTVLRTNVATTGNLILGPEFLNFNSNVRESGYRALWSLHAAYYYRHLSLIAEWQSGFQDYALASSPTLRTHLPVESYYIQAGYFLTGETVNSRGMVKPIHDFDLRRGKFGWGAFELAGRYNPLDIGRQVFTNGLADPNLWANRLYTYDVGFNWYWTQYLKLSFTVEHAEFNQPVLIRPNTRTLASTQYLFRFQINF